MHVLRSQPPSPSSPLVAVVKTVFHSSHCLYPNVPGGILSVDIIHTAAYQAGVAQGLGFCEVVRMNNTSRSLLRI